MKVTIKQSLIINEKLTIPAGTELNFANESHAYFMGQKVELNLIPEIAMESNGTMTDKDFAKKLGALMGKVKRDHRTSASSILNQAQHAMKTSDPERALENELTYHIYAK